MLSASLLCVSALCASAYTKPAFAETTGQAVATTEAQTETEQAPWILPGISTKSLTRAAQSRSTMKQLQNTLDSLPACDQKSPHLLRDGDKYYDFRKATTDNRSHNRSHNSHHHGDELADNLVTFLTSIHGQWHGQALDKVCYRPGQSRLHIFDVDALTVSGPSRTYTKPVYTKLVTDRVRIASSDPRASSGKTRTITPSSLPPIDKIEDIEKLADGSFRLRSRARQKTTRDGNTVLREREDWLMNSARNLTWRTDWYVNGHYSGSEFSLLSR